MGNRYIVVGVDHYNPLGVIRSLGEADLPVEIILIGGKNGFVKTSKFSKDIYYVDNREEAYNALIEKLSQSMSDNVFVYTCEDETTEFFEKHYESLVGKCYFFNAGPEERIAYYSNKNNIYALAKKFGLNVLEAIAVNKGDIPDGLEYPIITKAVSSTTGGWKNDVYICHSECELKEAYNKITADKLVLQKYLKKKNEYCMEGFSVNHGKDMKLSLLRTDVMAILQGGISSLLYFLFHYSWF